MISIAMTRRFLASPRPPFENGDSGAYGFAPLPFPCPSDQKSSMLKSIEDFSAVWYSILHFFKHYFYPITNKPISLGPILNFEHGKFYGI